MRPAWPSSNSKSQAVFSLASLLERTERTWLGKTIWSQPCAESQATAEDRRAVGPSSAVDARIPRVRTECDFLSQHGSLMKASKQTSRRDGPLSSSTQMLRCSGRRVNQGTSHIFLASVEAHRNALEVQFQTIAAVLPVAIYRKHHTMTSL